MTHYFTTVVFSFSILLAAVVGCLRYHRITPGDRLFIYIVWVALINEILSLVFTAVFRSTAINNNVYVLVEALLYCLMYYHWNLGFQSRKKLIWLLVATVVFWIWDNLIRHRPTEINSLFRIFSSFILVFLAIDQINQLIVTERKRLMTNARFLISVGVVIFFTYRAIYEAFYLKILFSIPFYHGVNKIMEYVNLFVNLIFALAALWIPTRRKFILPS